MFAIMQIMKEVWVLEFVGRVRKLSRFFTANNTFIVCMDASSLIESLDSGGGGGAHFDRDLIALYRRLDN
jgi:hypothetical protein